MLFVVMEKVRRNSTNRSDLKIEIQDGGSKMAALMTLSYDVTWRRKQQKFCHIVELDEGLLPDLNLF